jgi:Na+/H+-translocating membrane pyrophosphatase
VVLSRRIGLSDQSFSGIVLGSLSLSYFDSLFARIAAAALAPEALEVRRIGEVRRQLRVRLGIAHEAGAQLNGTPVVVLSRRIGLSDQSFSGIVLGSLSLSYFEAAAALAPEALEVRRIGEVRRQLRVRLGIAHEARSRRSGGGRPW